MPTLEEVLADVVESPGFGGENDITANSRGSNGETPLHWMASLGDVEGIRVLVEAGADINATNEKGNTPLHESTICRQVDAARKLIELGANRDLKNSDQRTPAAIALHDAFSPMVDLLKV